MPITTIQLNKKKQGQSPNPPWLFFNLHEIPDSARGLDSKKF